MAATGSWDREPGLPPTGACPGPRGEPAGELPGGGGGEAEAVTFPTCRGRPLES